VPDAFSPMPKISEGFFLGTKYPWGTVYDDARRPFQFEGIIEQHLTYRSVCTLPLESAYGFQVASAEFAANHTQTPVMEVSYEFLEEGSNAADSGEYFCNKLTKYFGQPVSSGPVPDSPFPRYGPAMRKFEPHYSAMWQDGDMTFHLSLRSNPKLVRGGRSIGTLRHSWNNAISAAAPYMPDLLKKEQDLAQWLPGVEHVARITLEVDQRRYAHSPDPATPFNSTGAKSMICLRKVDILETPDSVRQQLSPADVLVWRVPKSSKWGISIQFDTLVFDRTLAQLEWLELIPAKGKGSSHLRIGNLSFWSQPRSPQIAALVATIRKMPNVFLNTIEDYDY